MKLQLHFRFETICISVLGFEQRDALRIVTRGSKKEERLFRSAGGGIE
jgi:hypothetical protein